MRSFASQLTNFYLKLVPPELPSGIEVLHPQAGSAVRELVRRFFLKFYNDTNQRGLMLGINPGRFGAGITGINFTAPRQLRQNCGIEHDLGNSSELSAEFIYDVIEQYGGAAAFYADFFIGSMSPLGYVKDGKNINYYDEKPLVAAVTPFIVQTLQQQIRMGFSRQTCLCIGGEKNYRFLAAINTKHKLFTNIVPLPHPRFVMQYRRKRKQEYVDQYLQALLPVKSSLPGKV